MVLTCPGMMLTMQEVKKAIDMVKENKDKYLGAWHGFFSD